MSFSLFADVEPAQGGITAFLRENGLLLLPIVVGFLAIYALLPGVRRVKPLWAGAAASAALVVGASLVIRMGGFTMEAFLFYAFAGIAIVAGTLMITQKNPVHSALSFALVVLSTCGLFLLQAAPFLMAATIIVYAGAIVVTFLFVIMLAQQEGPSNANGRSREPFLASLAGGVLLASLLCLLHKTYDTRAAETDARELKELTQAADLAEVKRLLGDPTKDESSRLIEKLKAASDMEVVDAANNMDRHWRGQRLDPLKRAAGNALAVAEKKPREQGSLALWKVPGKDQTPGHFTPGKLPAGNVAAIGKTLFTDYLIAVELAATLLLVATIGAIAIANRKTEELR